MSSVPRPVRTWLAGLAGTLLVAIIPGPPVQAQGNFTTTRVAADLHLPLFVTAPPGDTRRLFIVQQTGQIRILNLTTGTINPKAFLNLREKVGVLGEAGMLGLAFDPNYAANGRFYVNYISPGGAFDSGVTHIAQFNVSPNPDVADPRTEKTLLRLDQPQLNHNGGWIGFSPRAGDEGNLYIATGDGGNENDAGPGHIEPGGNAQNTTTLFGKMLRIHINERPSGTYSIPPDNPFAGSSTDRQEIWAFGLRNPFRNSFDRQTGTMFIGDVGQETREEIDVQSPANPGGGENFGWRVREGSVQNPAYPNDPIPPDAVDPIYDYAHEVGQTVIGGYVYRGSQIPALRGFYVFADYLGPEGGSRTGMIFALRYDGHSVSQVRDITAQLFPSAEGDLLNRPTSLGEDAEGELYIVDYIAGSVYKIVPR